MPAAAGRGRLAATRCQPAAHSPRGLSAGWGTPPLRAAPHTKGLFPYALHLPSFTLKPLPFVQSHTHGPGRPASSSAPRSPSRLPQDRRAARPRSEVTGRRRSGRPAGSQGNAPCGSGGHGGRSARGRGAAVALRGTAGAGGAGAAGDSRWSLSFYDYCSLGICQISPLLADEEQVSWSSSCIHYKRVVSKGWICSGFSCSCGLHAGWRCR